MLFIRYEFLMFSDSRGRPGSDPVLKVCLRRAAQALLAFPLASVRRILLLQIK